MMKLLDAAVQYISINLENYRELIEEFDSNNKDETTIFDEEANFWWPSPVSLSKKFFFNKNLLKNKTQTIKTNK